MFCTMARKPMESSATARSKISRTYPRCRDLPGEFGTKKDIESNYKIQNFPITKSCSSLPQRQVFAVIAEHIQNLYRSRRDPDHLVAPVHDVAFLGNENIFVLGQENPLNSTLRCGKAVEHQIAWRRRRRWWRPVVDYRLRLRFGGINHDFRNLHKRRKNISSRAFVLRILARLEQIQPQCRIKTSRLALLLRLRIPASASRSAPGRWRGRLLEICRRCHRSRRARRAAGEPAGELRDNYPHCYCPQRGCRNHLGSVFCTNLHYVDLR